MENVVDFDANGLWTKTITRTLVSFVSTQKLSQSLLWIFGRSKGSCIYLERSIS